MNEKNKNLNEHESMVIIILKPKEKNDDLFQFNIMKPKRNKKS